MLMVRAAWLTIALLLSTQVFAQSEKATPEGQGIKPNQKANSPAKSQQDASPKEEPAKSNMTVIRPRQVKPAQPPITKKETAQQAKADEEKAMESLIIAGYAVKITDFFIALFNFLLMVFTLGLWRSTDKLWKATERSINLAREEFISTHRPEIRIKHVVLTGELWKDAPIEIKLIIVNCGSTTARITECNIATFIHPANASLPARPAFKREPFIPAPSTDLESGSAVVLPSLTDGHPLSDAENTGIRDLTLRLYCYGYVDYLDDAGKLRSTSFCRFLNAPSHPVTHQDIGKFVLHADPDYEYQD